MKIWSLILLNGLCAYGAQAGFKSSVKGVSISNFHEVSTKGTVYRGSEPKDKLGELTKLGITNVIIFKNETKGEVQKESLALKKLGFTNADIKSIPFLWKDVKDQQLACEQVIESLLYIGQSTKDGGKIFFHCTVGEDRTGLLAGLYHVYRHGWSTEKAYQEEMCLHGYAHGNPNKPLEVAEAVKTNLTPVYLKVALIIEKAKKDKVPLSIELCNSMSEIEIAEEFPSCLASSLAM